MVRRAVLTVACALATMAGAFRFTAAPGPGLDPDAMSYLGAAQSLVTNGTLRVPLAPWTDDRPSLPLAHFPPGYSAAIAVPILFGANATNAARIVQATAAAATVALLIFALWPLAGGVGAVMGAVVLVLTPAFVFVQLQVLSEPLFLALITLMLWSLVRRPRAALTHGLIAAAATMVRYAGLSMAGAAALWALRDRRAPWRDRLWRAALALAPSLLAMAVWSLTRERAPGGTGQIRTVAMYGHWAPTLQQGAETAARLLAPTLEWEPAPWLAAAGVLAAFVALTWSTVRLEGEVRPEPAHDDPRWADQRVLLQAAGCVIAGYVALLVASRAFADPNIPFDFRLLLPLLPPLIAAITVVAARAWRVISTPARILGVLACAGWMVLAVRADQVLLSDALEDGGDFASRTWRESPTLGWVRAQDPARAIYTNWPCAVWFHLGRTVHDLPAATDSTTVRRFLARLDATGGTVVAWKAQSADTAPTDALVAAAGLVRIKEFSDGAVYAKAPPDVAPPTVAPPAVRR
jgi:hypothetical protein